MGGLLTFVLRHKLLMVMTWLVLTLAGLAATMNIEDRLTGQLAQPGQPAYEANKLIAERYGTGGEKTPLVPVVVLPAGTTVDDPAAMRALRTGFDQVARETRWRVVGYPGTADPELVGSDRRTTFGLVFPATGGGHGGGQAKADKIDDILLAALPRGSTVHVTGMDPLEESSGGNGVNLGVEIIVGAVGALLVLAFVFGSFLALVPLIIGLASIATSFLIVYGLTEITDLSAIIQFIIGLVGLGVSIDYALLVVTRWREERSHGLDNELAIAKAMGTAGRAVVSSGATVAIGLFAMIFLPLPFLRNIAIGGMVIPFVSVLAVVTLLPVLLAKIGHRMDWPHRRRDASASRGWTAWARLVVRFRWAAVLLSAAALTGLSVAAFGLHLGPSESSQLATSGPAYQGLSELRGAGVSSGWLTPIDVVVPAGTDPAGVADELGRVSGVRTVLHPEGREWRADGGSALITVVPVDEGGSDAGKATVTALRDAAPAGVRIGGSTAQSMDFVDSVYGAFPLMLVVIAVVTLILLTRTFRSVVLPLKAIVLNLLSLGAVLGAVVLVWQRGHGSEQIWGISPTGSIAEFIPVMVFAFLYGLSMDYEVFILARIREEYDRSGSTSEAIIAGIGRTGRLVTSAALILFLAFAALAAAPGIEIKIFATALGMGILLDATLIRALFVPALIAVLGRATWWLPGWLGKLLLVRRPEQLAVAGGAADGSAPPPVRLVSVGGRTTGEPGNTPPGKSESSGDTPDAAS